jgi:salicylate hydroxylase
LTRRAIIAGGGIAGLSCALALSQSGFNVVLCERANAHEEFGAGLQLTPNATRVLSRLGVLERVRAVAMSPRAICAFRGSDDLALMRMSVEYAERRWGAPYLAIHRADLQLLLVDALRHRPNVELRLGTTVTDVAMQGDRISVGLKRGSASVEEWVDLLIGADGLRSRVRESFSPEGAEKPTFTGRIAFRTTVASACVNSSWAQPEVGLRLGPSAHLVHYPLRGESVVNLVAIVESAWRGAAGDHPWDGVADRPALERAFSSWSKETRDLLGAAKDWRAWPLYCRPPTNRFSLGRIALVGDAAHPMVPFLAQGAAQAIEDAGAFQRIFSQTESVPDGLVAYSRVRVERARRVQVEAQRQGQIYHLDGMMALARDFVMKMLGPERLSARYDWLYGA